MLKNWLKGFGVGLMIMLAVSGIMFIMETTAIFLSGGEVPTYDLLVGIMAVWFSMVIVLEPYGSMPNTFFIRCVFVWLPMIVGWFFFQKGMSLSFFFIGMCISSTCVGYNIVVVRGRKKRH